MVGIFIICIEIMGYMRQCIKVFIYF